MEFKFENSMELELNWITHNKRDWCLTLKVFLGLKNEYSVKWCNKLISKQSSDFNFYVSIDVKVLYAF
jgi:hypothetical protein